MKRVLFKRLHIRNFLLFKEEEIEFKTGLTLILGENLDEFDSNGSGKTILKESIPWTLFGETTSGETRVALEKRRTECRFELLVDDSPVEVVRSQSSGSTTLRITTAAGEITKDSTTTISQLKLNLILGMNIQVFRSVICFGGSDHRGFAAMADKERKELFNQVLGLDVWESYAGAAKERRLKVQEIQNRLLLQQNTLITKGNSLDDSLEGLLTRRAALGERPVTPVTDTLVDAETQEIRALEAEIQSLKHQAAEADLRVRASIEIRNEIKLVQGNITTLEHQENEIKKQQAQASAEIKDTKAGICPTCKQVVRNQDLMDKFLLKQKSLGGQLTTVRSKISEGQERIELLSSGDSGIDTNSPAIIRRTIVEKEYKVQQIRLRLENLASTMHMYSLAKSKFDAAAGEIEKSITAVTEERERVVADKQACDLQLINYHKYLLVAKEAELMFGRTGIQNKIVEEIEAPFNQILRGFMRAFGYRGATLDMVPKKKLASGEERDKIDIQILDHTGKKRSLTSFSGGEHRRIDLVFFLSLNELFSTHVYVNYLALDEVLNNMDREGLDCMKTVLLDSCAGRAVWVLAPTDSIEWSFDQRIRVQKEKGVSKVVPNA